MIIGNILEKSASKGKISNPPPEKLLQRHLEKRNAFLENQIKVVLVVAATQVQPSTSVCGPRKLAQIIKLTRWISSLRPKIWSLHQSHTKSLLSVLLPVQSEWLMVDELGLLSLNEARSWGSAWDLNGTVLHKEKDWDSGGMPDELLGRLSDRCLCTIVMRIEKTEWVGNTKTYEPKVGMK